MTDPDASIIDNFAIFRDATAIIEVTFVPTPEPSTLGLGLLGLGSIALAARAKHRHTSRK